MSWPTRTLQELATLVTSGSRGWGEYYSDEGALFLRVGDLNRLSIELDLRSVAHVRPPVGAEGARTMLQEGDIVMSITADVGMVGVVPSGLGDAYVNQHLALVRLKPESLLPRFAAYALLNPEGLQRAVQGIAYGATKASLSLSQLRELRLPVPPIEVQRRIVAKLDEMLAKTRAAREQLEAVPALVEQYRQSVLAAAFRGDLTADWRKKNPDVEPASKLLERIRIERRQKWEAAELAKFKAKGKSPKDDKWKSKYVEPEPVDTSDLPELPPTWCWARVDEAGQVDLGRMRSPDNHSGANNKPYLRVKNVYEDRIDTSDVMTMHFSEEEFDFYRLIAGDVLLNEGQSRELES